METKFKIGDEIFYMKYSEPAKGIIKGIAFVIGEFEDSSFKRKAVDGKPSITYSVGSYVTIEEANAFSTKDELQNYLFKNL